MMKKKVALGLSGGVDSAVTAILLLEQGYDVTGIYIECWNEPGCRAEQDRKDALQVALKLGIPFKTLDFKKQYKKEVMGYFLSEYKAGRTPNPDVLCNNVIKFGMFYDWAIDQNNFDFIATGHYAQIKDSSLLAAADLKKDQTYFLHQIKKHQLEHVLFPIGHLQKTEIRDLAQKHNLHVANKKDSVGICFVGDINVSQFLKDELGENPGDVVDINGNIIGKHNGLWLYTIGQRQGFEINTKKLITKTSLVKDKNNPPALYVIGKNLQKNQIIVGDKSQTKTNSFSVENLYWIDQAPTNPKELFVKIRNTAQLQPCELNNKTITSKEEFEGVAPGQFAVIYEKTKSDNFLCLGGGVIS